MFDSLSLSRKGPLGSIWVAAYCYKRLKKAQVAETDIPISVDKILQDELHVVTYRVLGYFLLGVVRIYSKKVEYLFDDCHKVLIKVKEFVVSEIKKHDSCADILGAPRSSISLPKRFELDAFDLEIVDDVSGGNLMLPEEITLRDDTWRNKEIALSSIKKHRWEEGTLNRDPSSSDNTTVKDDLPSHSRAMVTDHGMGASENQYFTSVERLLDDRFQEECSYSFTFLGVGGNSLDPDWWFGGDNHADEQQMSHKEVSPASGEKIQDEIYLQKLNKNSVTDGTGMEPSALIDAFVEEHFSHPQTLKLPELLLTETGEHEVLKTPEKQDVQAVCAPTPDFMLIPTPAPMERPRRKRKRKCLYDDLIQLPNADIRKNICDASDLVCKRSKAPHNAYAVWKATRLANASVRFLEPLLPCTSPDLRNLFLRKDIDSSVPEEAARLCEKVDGPEILVPQETAGVCEKGYLVEVRTDDTVELGIAPETPVKCSSSRRPFESPNGSTPDGTKPEKSNEIASLGQDLPMVEDQDFDFSLMNEEMSSSAGHNHDECGWTGRTRQDHLTWLNPFIIVAGHLQRMSCKQIKRGEKDVLCLSQVSEGKTEKESARLFYEILVLKSEGYIEVEQRKAYGDILMRWLPRWEQDFGADGP
ncbi:sister chromatid cohesion 1 protein 2 isoform X2 [Rhodamnia argentea]|uniref:Sister chromatid cohesion 1 protein 2 isoform X2 n=1 Tax=Rhodamnia argentea TaxID=178133 RepID=A0ABM3HRT2_9MYRT|nr:sister chromatid cohesion 1 protein 2 isoform X2 [Rhodamnia argentea]